MGCASGKAVAGGGEARALPSRASKEVFVRLRRGLFPGSAGHYGLAPLGAWAAGRVLRVFFFRVQIKRIELSED